MTPAALRLRWGLFVARRSAGFFVPRLRVRHHGKD